MLEIILVQGFCPLKVEITQFPSGFHLNINLKAQRPYMFFTSTGRLSPGLNLFHGKNLVRLEKRGALGK